MKKTYYYQSQKIKVQKKFIKNKKLKLLIKSHDVEVKDMTKATKMLVVCMYLVLTQNK